MWHLPARKIAIGTVPIVVLVGGFFLSRQLWPPPGPSTASAVPPIFDWSEFLPPSRSRDGQDDWQETVEGGAYSTFERLRRDLVKNRITSDAIIGFESIINEPKRLGRIRELLTALDGDMRTEAISRLYAELMQAESNPDVLFEYLKHESKRLLDFAEATPDDNGAYFGWGLSVTSYGCVLAYEATTQVRFLEQLMDVVEQALEYRDDRTGRMDEARGRVMHSWGGTRYTKDGRHTTNITLAGRVCFPMLRFCQIVRETPQLQARLAEQAERYLTEARVCMDEYESEFRIGPLPGEGYYYSVTHDEVEALNHQAWAGNALILLHDLTGEEKYGRMARQLATFFRNCMWIDEQNCMVWTYMPSPDNRRGPPLERVWKARVTSQFPLFAYKSGIVFGKSDMESIALMFAHNIHRGNGVFSSRIDDTFDDLERYKDLRAGYLSLSPFIMYEEFRPEIRDVLEELVASRPDVGGWLKPGPATIAYAYRLSPTVIESGRESTAGISPSHERFDN